MSKLRVYVYLIAAIFIFAYSALSLAQSLMINPVPGFERKSTEFNSASHTGLDIVGPSAGLIAGKPIVATLPGTVIQAGVDISLR